MPSISKQDLEKPRALATFADELYRMRRARDEKMPRALFGEPAWDMLLSLYTAEEMALPITALELGSGLKRSTAVRWVAALHSQGLVQPAAPGERDRDQVVLTREGRSVLETSLEAMLRIAHR